MAILGPIKVSIAEKALKLEHQLPRTKSTHKDLSKLTLWTPGQPRAFEIQGIKVGQFINIFSI
jgi:hypothetical protein